MKAIDIIEKMCYIGDCACMSTYDCHDEDYTKKSYLNRYFGTVVKQTGQLKPETKYLYIYETAYEYTVEQMNAICQADVIIETDLEQRIFLWAIE